MNRNLRHIILTIAALVLAHNFALGQKQTNLQAYVFPAGDSEYSVVFPNKPTIKAAKSEFGYSTTAEIMVGDSVLRASYAFMDEKTVELMADADDAALYKVGQEQAKVIGLSNPNISVKKDAKGILIKSRAEVNIKGTSVTMEHYVFYGKKSMLEVLVVSPSTNFPTPAINNFLNSFKRQYDRREEVYSKFAAAFNNGSFTFPENSQEYTVEFPQKPEIKDVYTKYANLKLATLVLPDGILQAEYGVMPEGLASAVEDGIETGEAFKVFLEYAEKDGLSNTEVSTEKNSLGRLFIVRGNKTVQNLPRIFQRYIYYGRTGFMILTISSDSKIFPTIAATKFLKSIIRLQNQNNAAEKVTSSTPISIFIFPENNSQEFTIEFPQKPLIEVHSIPSGSVNTATLSWEDNIFLVGYSKSVTKKYAAMRVAPDKDWIEIQQKFAKEQELTNIEIKVARNHNGRFSVLRGNKMNGEEILTFERYMYFRKNILLTVAVASSAKNFPTPAITNFLNSIKFKN